MIAKMAITDLQQMRARGYAPTDAEVIRLNDLGVRIERGRQTTVANMPRTAMAGNVTLHEPTVAAIEWWHNFGRDASWTTRGKLDTYYYMLANCTDIDAFRGLEYPHAIRREVRAWKRSVFATEGELWRALLWVRHGELEEDGQADKKAVSDSLADEETLERIFRMVIAAAGALGVSPNDLKSETPSTLMALLVEANIHAKIPMKASIAQDYIAYQKTIRDIEARGVKEVV